MTEEGLKSYKPRVCASTWTMFWLVQKRAWTQHARSKFSFVIDNLLVFVASLFLGLVYFGDVIYTPPQPVEVRTDGCLPQQNTIVPHDYSLGSAGFPWLQRSDCVVLSTLSVRYRR
jgi:hypothetical protein